MKIRRFYFKKEIKLAHIQGIHGILLTQLKWQLDKVTFVLYYPGETIEINNNIDEIAETLKKRGKPDCVQGSFKATVLDALAIETCWPDDVVIEVEGKSENLDEVFAQVEPMLELKQRKHTTTEQPTRSAFIAHAFDDDGYARELSNFLNLLGIVNESGREYSPQSVTDKVRERLAKHDLFFAIVTPQQDPTWLIQECAAASLSRKHTFVLKQNDAEFKQGLLGDLEIIPFPRGQISQTFVHILEGLKYIELARAATQE